MKNIEKIVLYLSRRNFTQERFYSYYRFSTILFMPIIIFGIFNLFLKITESNFFLFVYWGSLLIINIHTLIYIFYFSKLVPKVAEKYLDNLLKDEKVICCWKDKSLTKGSTYKIVNAQQGNGHINLNGYINLDDNNIFILSSYNISIFKLVTVREQRRLKLKKLRN